MPIVRKDIALSFEGAIGSAICIPRVSPVREERYDSIAPS